MLECSLPLNNVMFVQLLLGRPGTRSPVRRSTPVSGHPKSLQVVSGAYAGFGGRGGVVFCWDPVRYSVTTQPLPSFPSLLRFPYKGTVYECDQI